MASMMRRDFGSERGHGAIPSYQALPGVHRRDGACAQGG